MKKKVFLLGVFLLATPRAGADEVGTRLAADVRHLAEVIGDRGVDRPAAREAARVYIEARWRAAGLEPRRLPYTVEGVSGVNLEAVIPGVDTPEKTVVVGAHYDSVAGSPGADDNASGVAVLLELGRRLAAARPACTLRLVAFDLEEPPVYRTAAMGSVVDANACRARGDDVVFMMALDGLGFYDDTPGSQRYPAAAGGGRPDAAVFLALIGHARAPGRVVRASEVFAAHTPLPVETLVGTDDVPGVGWSDHWSFWQAGYEHAFFATDTLPMRYDHYHTGSDTPDRLDYVRMGQALEGLEAVVRDAAGAGE